jgi:predicted HicB family RNase H-like nuclease
MNNIMTCMGARAKISYQPESEMFRGEILGLTGGADFYAKDVESLKVEFEKSLRLYLSECARTGAEAYKNYSGKFLFRTSSETHEALEYMSIACGVSINSLMNSIVSMYIESNE